MIIPVSINNENDEIEVVEKEYTVDDVKRINSTDESQFKDDEDYKYLYIVEIGEIMTMPEFMIKTNYAGLVSTLVNLKDFPELCIE